MARNYFVPKRVRNAFPEAQDVIWRLEAAIIGLLLAVFRILPLQTSLKFGGILFATFGPYTPRADKVRMNLRVVHPNKSAAQIKQLSKAIFRHLGTAMAELVRMDKIWQERDQRIEFKIHRGARIPTPDKRIVFVTAHCSAWQLTTLIAPHYGLTVPLIYAPEENPYVDRKLVALRNAFGSPMVSRDGGIRVLMRALDQGHSIGLTMDTRMDAGELLPFFGEQALTNTAPARLALRYDCEFLPVRAERLPNACFRIHIYPAIKPRNPDVPRADQARDMSRQVNAMFETWIQDAPGEWLCFKRRWPKAIYARYDTED